MKKLVMFGAAVALAMSMQAGSFIWGFSGGCDDPLGTSGGWYEGATAFQYYATMTSVEWVDNIANGGPWVELAGDVPEPTSGLLLLLGGSLLALRRKRA